MAISKVNPKFGRGGRRARRRRARAAHAEAMRSRPSGRVFVSSGIQFENCNFVTEYDSCGYPHKVRG